MSGLTRRLSREICEGLKIAWQLANAERPTERRGGGWLSIAEEGQPNSGSLVARRVNSKHRTTHGGTT